MAHQDELYRMSQILDAAPELDPTSLEQTAALPLGGRVKLDPWSASIELMKNNRVALLSPREIWSVDVESGAERMVAPSGVQPSWSPTGDRIAYFDIQSGRGQRDLYTVAAGGGEPVAVAESASFDWNPVWSRDGRYLYFSSDRSGGLSIWRVSIDQASGRVTVMINIFGRSTPVYPYPPRCRLRAQREYVGPSANGQPPAGPFDKVFHFSPRLCGKGCKSARAKRSLGAINCWPLLALPQF